ncbi:MAG: hypothetical protein HQM07_02140 [Zetaproteobacteria bacterium]|nr:hypothetical protein [Zetaproteobacteria bacterium]
MRFFPYVVVIGLVIPLLVADSIPSNLGNLNIALAVLMLAAYPWKDHHERTSIVSGLFFLCGFSILYTWNISDYPDEIHLNRYGLIFGVVLFLWAFLKIKFKGYREVFLTSSFEFLMIFIAWFIPYMVLPIISAPAFVMTGAKLACLESIPLFMALKILIKRQAHRNQSMAIAFVFILLMISVKSMLG